jgi:hypothetical protein
MKNRKPIIVYWSYATTRQNYPFMRLLDSKPQSLFKEMFKDEVGASYKNDRYSSCPSARILMNNMFFCSLPFDAEVHLSDGNIVSSSHDGWWMISAEPMMNRTRLDFDMGWTFFCEEPLEIEVTPPYMHKSTSSEGFMAAGILDIGRWFRSVNLTWILEKDQKSLSIKKEEPLIYFKFKTDRKVIFKEFVPTDITFSAFMAVPRHSRAIGKLEPTLEKRYNLFAKTKMAKLLLREIKENLVDDE